MNVCCFIFASTVVHLLFSKEILQNEPFIEKAFVLLANLTTDMLAITDHQVNKYYPASDSELPFHFHFRERERDGDER